MNATQPAGPHVTQDDFLQIIAEKSAQSAQEVLAARAQARHLQTQLTASEQALKSAHERIAALTNDKPKKVKPEGEAA